MVGEEGDYIVIGGEETVEDEGTPSEHRRLDEQQFPHFAPLLRECQDYAVCSGCRFRASSFDGYADIGSSSSNAPRRRCSEARGKAKVVAAASASSFAKRLGDKEPGLIEEVERAYRTVMAESVRNAMIGMFQELEMFPPSPRPREIDDTDCTYQDVTAPLPVVSQRLYNDEVRRVEDASRLIYKRATTSAFLVDFAEYAKVSFPPIPETYHFMLQEITERIQEVQLDAQVRNQARNAFITHLGRGIVAENLRRDVTAWWEENKTTAMWAVVGGALGLAAGIAIGLSQNRRSNTNDSCRG